MKSFLQKNPRLVFYGLWLLLGLIQAGLTELQDDEAYYWVYSRYLDWGYFDHPPMIAVLVKMGYAIFPNALGVRLFPLLLNIFSLVIIEKLIYTDQPGKKPGLLFYSIVLSIAVLQLTGFMAVPDIPLIFFTALFFYCYKKFVATASWMHTLWLGLSMALLFYSKYHAVLIVLFTVLSNFKLLTQYKAYIAAFIALLLFGPHLWWQYQHDWVSFKYHLFESNVNDYKPAFTLEYLAGQLLLPGPLAGFILLPAALLYRPADKTERALRFTMIGIYLFFLLSSFRGKVEANWTSPVLVSLIVLSYGYISQKKNWQRALRVVLPITMLLVVVARVVMIEDILPVKAIRQRYHAWKDWPAMMKEKTKGLPVVFSNSYQRAAKYWFYTGQMTYSQNDAHGRRNNYNFWPIEERLFGSPVYFLDIYNLSRFTDTMKTSIGTIGYRYDTAFLSFAAVQVKTSFTKYSAAQNQAIQLSCSSAMPDRYRAYLESNKNIPATLSVLIFKRATFVKQVPVVIGIHELLRKEFTVTFQPQLPPGEYYFRLSIQKEGYNPTHNSEKISLTIR